MPQRDMTSPGEGAHMHRRHTPLTGIIAAVTLALGASALGGTVAGHARAADPASPLTLWAPQKLVAYSYQGSVYTDLGLRLVAPLEPFELWSSRASYADPIVTEWRSPSGTVVLPEGTMETFSGLADFVDIEVRKVSTGAMVESWQQTACLNGSAQRVRPDAPARSPYPWGCPWNPYTVGSVMGIEAGYSSSLVQDYGLTLGLRPGKYDVTSTIADDYTALFGISPADARRVTRLVVKRQDSYPQSRPRQPRSVVATPHAQEPPGASGGRVADPKPDLRSLPAFGIGLNRKGTTLRFAATVWNAGDSPLVVDGFRGDGEDHMDAYQYFFDADGNQTGYQSVGEMHWHAENHQHWHFEDFAQYRLFDEDMSEVVLSTKQSFCLANTDAVDYTVPDADWHHENTDLATACGGFDALSVRQVLSAGSGDTYLQYRYGQAFPIADLPNGVYHIGVQANPLGNLVESDTTNNDSYRRIRIGGKPDRRWVRAPQVGIVVEDLPFDRRG